MFAILIAPVNLPKIFESPRITEKFYNDGLKTYLAQSSNWYFVSGYVNLRGAVLDFNVIPEHLLVRDFEYDPDKIKTDWDQIVRK